MKIDRRGFLSFVAGGAAGTALSPLNWKLMDDVAIWTQSWPWIPKPKDGESVYIDTVCSLCSSCCGITVRKIDNRVVKIDGNDTRFNGGICALGLSGLQLLYGASRVTGPLLRDGNRGDGNWKEISWKDAISIISKELGAIRLDGETDKLACISGSGFGTVPYMIKRFLRAYGSKNFIRMPNRLDPHSFIARTMYGGTNVDFDIENADFIINFDSGLFNIRNSIGVPRSFSNFEAKGDKKVVVYQVGPRISGLCSNVEKWLLLNPGTESDLAFGLAALIIKHGLYDKAFISENVKGFDDLSRFLLSKYPVDLVSEVTGLDKDIIVSLAKSFSKSSRSLAVCEGVRESTLKSFKEHVAVHLLNVLNGNINKPGGLWVFSDNCRIDWPEVEFDDIAIEGLSRGKFCNFETDDASNCDYLINELIDSITDDADQDRIRALFVANTNPCYSLSDSLSVKSAFDKIPFVISFSSFMDETTSSADLVLPDHVYLEKYEDVYSRVSIDKKAVKLSVPVVSAEFNTKYLGDTIIEIANSLGGSVARSFYWGDYKSCLMETMAGKWDFLKNNGVWVDDRISSDVTVIFDVLQFDFSDINIDGDNEVFPLVLVPYESVRLVSGYIGAPPFLMKILDDDVLDGDICFVDINPQTAKDLNFCDGDNVFLSTPKCDDVEVKVHIYEGIKPGVVGIPRGLGHKAYGGYLAGKGVNVNELVNPVKDPVLGYDAGYGIRVKLTKV